MGKKELLHLPDASTTIPTFSHFHFGQQRLVVFLVRI
jgi:hypothetical protein